MTVRVLIVDDHAVVRDGLARLLAAAADIEVAGTAGAGDEALTAVASSQPDVVLMDLSMPGLDGVAATQLIKEQYPDTQVLVLTSFSDHHRIVEAVRAGASGYLLKDAEPDEILRGIRSAAEGQSPFSPRVARTLVDLATARPSPQELSAREWEVLDCLTQGMANKQIARQLGIKEKTVKAHLSSIYLQLGVSDRTQAALWAQQHRRGP